MLLRRCAPWGIVAVLIVAVFAAAGTAGAQEQEGAEARRLFEEADRAIDEDRLADARDLLQRSLELRAHPATAFNLAMVYRAVGENLAAAEVFERLEDGELGDLDAQKRAEVAALLAEVLEDIARLDVGVRGAGGELRIDGQRVASVDPGGRSQHRVDAGRHVVSVTTADGRVHEQEVRLSQGEERRLDFELGAAEPHEGGGESDGDSVLASPWLWLSLAAVAVAAGIVVTVLLLPGEDEGDPIWGVARPILRW